MGPQHWVGGSRTVLTNYISHWSDTKCISTRQHWCCRDLKSLKNHYFGVKKGNTESHPPWIYRERIQPLDKQNHRRPHSSLFGGRSQAISLFVTPPLSSLSSPKPILRERGRSEEKIRDISQACETCVEEKLGSEGLFFFFCLCLLKFTDLPMFPLHSSPSDVFLSYLVTSFQKQIFFFLGLSRKL